MNNGGTNMKKNDIYSNSKLWIHESELKFIQQKENAGFREVEVLKKPQVGKRRLKPWKKPTRRHHSELKCIIPAVGIDVKAPSHPKPPGWKKPMKKRPPNRRLLSVEAKANQLKEEKQVSSIDHALSYFVHEEHRQDLLYFKRTQKNNTDSTPYTLERINDAAINTDTEHYVMSSSNLMRSKVGEPSECIPVSDWIYQSRMYDQLTKGLPFFRQFKLQKIFRRWSEYAKQKIFLAVRSKLAKKLLYTREHLALPLLQVLSICRGLQVSRPLRLPEKCSQSVTLLVLNATQDSAFKHLKMELGEKHMAIRKVYTDILGNIRHKMEDQCVTAEVYEDDIRTLIHVDPKLKSTPIALMKQKKEQIRRTREEAHTDFDLAGPCSMLMRYILFENLYLMVIDTITYLRGRLDSKDCAGALSVAASFVPDGIELSPNGQDVKVFFVEGIERIIKLLDTTCSIRSGTTIETRAESNKQKDLLNFETTLQNDLRLHEILDDLMTTLVKIFKEGDEHAETFECLRAIFDHFRDNPPCLMAEISTDNVSHEQISDLIGKANEELAQIRKYSHICHRAHTHRNVSFIEIQCRKIVSEVMDELTNRKRRIVDHGCHMLDKAIEQKIQIMKDATSLLDERPQTVELFCEQALKVRELQENERDLQLDLRSIDELYRVMKQQSELDNFTIGSQYNGIHNRYTKYVSSMHGNNKFQKKNWGAMGNRILQGLLKHAGKCQGILRTIKDPGFNDPEQDLQHQLDRLESMKTEIDYLSGVITRHQLYQERLQGEKISTRELDQLTSEFNRSCTLWQYASEWNSIGNSQQHIVVKQLNASDLRATNDTMVAKVVEFNRKFWSVLGQNIVDEIEHVRKEIDVLERLAGSYMQECHWAQVFETLEMAPDSNCTIQDLRTHQFYLYAEQLMTIAQKAEAEIVVFIKLEKMKQQWEITTLALQPFEDTYELNIPKTAELLTELDEDLTQCQIISRAVTTPAIFTQIVEWIDHINYAQETIELWMKCQENYAKLSSVFGLTDVRSKVQQAATEHEAFTRKWKTMIQNVKVTPNVEACFKEVISRSFFEESEESMEKLWKELSEYLAMKRAAFARFCFVSDYEIFDIVARSQQSDKFSTIVSICFQHIHELILTSRMLKRNSGFSRYAVGMLKSQISGVKGSGGEMVVLNLIIEITKHPDEWMADFERILKQSIKLNLKECVGSKARLLYLDEDLATMKSGSFFSTAAVPAQVVLLVSKLLWTTNCTKILSSEGEFDFTWDTLVEKQNKLIEAAIEGLQAAVKSNDTLEFVPYSNLVLCAMNQRRNLFHLMDQKVNGTSDFEWIRLIRYYYNADESICTIHHGINSYSYGFDYLGGSSCIVATEITDRVLLSLTIGMRLSTGVLMHGPSDSGKGALLREFSHCLGVELLDFECSREVQLSQYSRILIGMLKSGLWLCLNRMHMISTQIMSAFVQMIDKIRLAVQVGDGIVQLEGQVIKFNTVVGLFSRITIDNNGSAENNCIRKYVSQFLPVACVIPKVRIIIESYLTTYGFKTASELATLTECFFDHVGADYSTSPGAVLNLRAVRTITQEAFHLKNCAMFTGEEQIVGFSIWKFVSPRVEQSKKKLLLSLLRSVFKNFTTSQVDARFMIIKRKTMAYLKKNHLEVSPSLPARVSELLQSLKTMYASIITGGASSGKSTLIDIAQSIMGNERDINYVKICTGSLSDEDFYGKFSDKEGTWKDGLIPCYIRPRGGDSKRKTKLPWLVFDGEMSCACVEPLYLMSQSSDSIYLANGERIHFADVRIIYETPCLTTWSPAAISRFGIVHLPADSLPFTYFVKRWSSYTKSVNGSKGELIDLLSGIARKHMPKLMEAAKSLCSSKLRLKPLDMVHNLLRIFTVHIETMNASSKSKVTDAKLLFLFAATWAFGGSLSNDGRKKFHEHMTEIMPGLKQHPMFQGEKTLFNVHFGISNGVVCLATWKMRLPRAKWEFSTEKWDRITIPTELTVCYEHLVEIFCRRGQNVLIMGEVGCSKSTTVQNARKSLNHSSSRTCHVGPQTTALDIQDELIHSLERTMKGVYAPPTGKRALLYIVEDLHLATPQCLEQIRQIVHYQTCFSRQNYDELKLTGVSLAATYTVRGGKFVTLGRRFLRHFHMLWKLQEESKHLMHACDTIAISFAQDYSCDTKHNVKRPILEKILSYAIELHVGVKALLRPRPSRPQYTFALGDLHRVLGGILLAGPINFKSPSDLEKLAVNQGIVHYRNVIQSHEDLRIFDEFNIMHCKRRGFSKAAIRYARNPQMYYYGAEPADTSTEGYQPLGESMCHELLHLISDSTDVVGDTGDNAGLVTDPTFIAHVMNLRNIIQRSQCSNVILLGAPGSGRQTSIDVARKSLFYYLVKLGPHGASIDSLKSHIISCGIKHIHTVISVALDHPHVEREKIVRALLRNGSLPEGTFSLFEEDAIIQQVPVDHDASEVPSRQQLLEKFYTNVKKYLHLSISVGTAQTLNGLMERIPELRHKCTIECFQPWDDSLINQAFDQFVRGWSLKLDATTCNRLKVAVCFIHDIILRNPVNMSWQVEKSAHHSAAINIKDMLEWLEKFYCEAQGPLLSLCTVYTKALARIDKDMAQLQQVLDDENSTLEYLNSIELEEEASTMEWVEEYDEWNRLKGCYADQEVFYKEAKALYEEAAAKVKAEMDTATIPLKEAVLNLGNIPKSQITQLRALGTPPESVRLVLLCVCVLLHIKPSWSEARTRMEDHHFLDRLRGLNAEEVTTRELKALKKYTKNKNFTSSPNVAANVLYNWIAAICKYHETKKTVIPLQLESDEAEEYFDQCREELEGIRQDLLEKENIVERLSNVHEEQVRYTDTVRRECEQAATRKRHYDGLQQILNYFTNRIETQLSKIQHKLASCAGNSLLKAATISFLGPYGYEQREELLMSWISKLDALQISCSPMDSILSIFYTKLEQHDICSKGLMNDQNVLISAWIIEKMERPKTGVPLIVDAQGAATSWLESLTEDKSCLVDADDPDLGKKIANHSMNSSHLVLIRGTGAKARMQFHRTLSAVKEAKHYALRVYFTTNVGFSSELSSEELESYQIINFSTTEKGLQERIQKIYMKETRGPSFHKLNAMDNAVANSLRETKSQLEDMVDNLCNQNFNLDDDNEVANILTRYRNMTLADANHASIAQTFSNAKATFDAKYGPIVVRGIALFKMSQGLERINPNFAVPLRRLIFLWRQCARTVARQRKTKAFSAVDSVTQQFISHICNGVPQELHLTLRFCFSVAVAQSSNRISDEIAALCLSLDYRLKRVSNDSESITKYQFAAPDIVTHLAHQVAKDVISKATSNRIRRSTRSLGTLMKRSYGRGRADGWKELQINRLVESLQSLSGLDIFQEIHQDIVAHPQKWRVYTMCIPQILHQLPEPWNTRLSSFEKLVFIATTHSSITEGMINEIVQTELGFNAEKRYAIEMEDIVLGATPSVPLLLLVPPQESRSLPVTEIHEYGERCRVASASIQTISMVNSVSKVLYQLNEMKEKCLIGGWFIVQDLIDSTSLGMQHLVEAIEDIHEKGNRCSPQFRLWIVSSVTEINTLPNGSRSVCRQIYFHEPIGIRGYLQYAQASLHVSKDLIPGSCFHNHLNATLLWHILCLTRLQYYAEGSGWSLPYRMGQIDLARAVQIVRMACNSYGLVMENITLAISELVECIYAGKITEIRDLECAKAILDRVFAVANHPDTSEDSFKCIFDSISTSIVTGDLSNVMGLSASHLGLPQCAEEISRQGNLGEFLHFLKCFRRKPKLSSVCKMRQKFTDIMMRLPGRDCFKHDGRRLMIVREVYKSESTQSFFNSVLIQEINQLEKYLETIWDSMDTLIEARSRIDVSNQPDLVNSWNAIAEGIVPQVWQESGHAIPARLDDWLTWLLSTVSFFQMFAKDQNPEFYWLSAFSNPSALLLAAELSFAAGTGTSICDVKLRAVGNVIDLDENETKYAIHVTGLFFRNVCWDEDENEISELYSTDELLQPVNFLLVPFKMDQDQYYECPIYKQLSWPGDNGRLDKVKNNYIKTIYIETECELGKLKENNVILVSSRHEIVNSEHEIQQL